MADGAPLSVPAADKRLRKVIYGFQAACCSIFLGALTLATAGRIPPGLVEAIGGSVQTVAGDERSMKVTRPLDLALAQILAAE